MKRLRIALICIIAAAIVAPVSAQAGFQARALLKKKIWFIADNKIDTTTYWSMHVGQYEMTIIKPFPGEGDVPIHGNFNFTFLSSMYIEGQGYTDRGKASEKGEYAIDNGGNMQVFELDSIDYVYGWGSKVKLLNGKDTDLLLKVQDNRLSPLGLMMGVWRYDKVYMELKKFKDVEGVCAYSFTKEGAARALAAQKALEAAQAATPQ